MNTPPPREYVIYNCHVHTFTINHVPRRFLPWPFGWLMRRGFLRRVLVPALRLSDRVWRCPRWLRYANYLNVTSQLCQKQVFELLQARYPRGTRFAVLPMDMAFIAGGPDADEGFDNLKLQHQEVASLCKHFGEAVIPFFAVDPRRPNVLDDLKNAIESQGFYGIKLYPNLGFKPTHKHLMPVWKYADERRLPVITHCSRGGLHGYDADDGIKVSEDNAHRYGAPCLYEPILPDFPNMRLCLAHIGGQKEWLRYLEDPWYVDDSKNNKENRSWLAEICEMVRKHPNLYTDISYTIFYFQEFVPALKVLLTDPALLPKVIFGSDYYMADLESDQERLLSINLRAALGEELFWQIANVNPKRFLFDSAMTQTTAEDYR